MTIDTLIILAGALVAVLPFLGFPNSWDTVLFFLLGILIVALGIVIRRRLSSESHESGSTFVESRARFDGVHEEV